MVIDMTQPRHKHKESFSLLLISNTGRSSRQYHLSLFAVRMFFVFLLIICIAAGFSIYQFGAGFRKQNVLRRQLAAQEQQVSQLETEKDTLNHEIMVLTSENEALRQASKSNSEEDTDKTAEPETVALPSRYPYTGTGILISTYSQEQPCISINTHSEGNIVAAGNGTVTLVSSDETYPLIVEVEHEGGYVTRYASHSEAQLQAEEGAQVQSGDILFTITTDDTQLDYQIILNGELIDPLTIIEAKG